MKIKNISHQHKCFKLCFLLSFFPANKSLKLFDIRKKLFDQIKNKNDDINQNPINSGSNMFNTD
jgi:hypothetical protein